MKAKAFPLIQLSALRCNASAQAGTNGLRPGRGDGGPGHHSA